MVDQLASVEGDGGPEEVQPVTIFASKAAGGGPVDFTAPTNVASGVTPVSGTFAATGQSSPFTPIAGRDFNLFLASGSGNTVQLERSRDAGSTWEVAMNPAAISAYQTNLGTSWSRSEPQYAVQYRWNCTAWVASQAYGISA